MQDLLKDVVGETIQLEVVQKPYYIDRDERELDAGIMQLLDDTIADFEDDEPSAELSASAIITRDQLRLFFASSKHEASKLFDTDDPTDGELDEFLKEVPVVEVVELLQEVYGETITSTPS